MQVQRKEDKVLVALEGRIIYENLTGTQVELDRLIGAGIREVFLKMDGLIFLDSSALAMLLRFNISAKNNGMTITMVAPPPPIRAVLNCTRLDHIFPILTEKEAESVTSQFAPAP